MLNDSSVPNLNFQNDSVMNTLKPHITEVYGIVSDNEKSSLGKISSDYENIIPNQSEKVFKEIQLEKLNTRQNPKRLIRMQSLPS